MIVCRSFCHRTCLCVLWGWLARPARGREQSRGSEPGVSWESAFRGYKHKEKPFWLGNPLVHVGFMFLSIYKAILEAFYCPFPKCINSILQHTHLQILPESFQRGALALPPSMRESCVS